jgi:hypothetical protein
MRPAVSIATYPGIENLAFVPNPFTNPEVDDPAMVVTVATTPPTVTIILIVWPCPLLTYNVPIESTVRPYGNANWAFVPCPSWVPTTPLPAIVDVTPEPIAINRIEWW